MYNASVILEFLELYTLKLILIVSDTINCVLYLIEHYQGGRTRSRQAPSHARNNWTISKIFHVSPLVTVQKIDQRARWGAGGK